ncbi:MAG TPA: antitoxin [Micrococcaceae bacterium]
MSIFDDIKGKAEELIHSNLDAVNHGIEKAGDFIDTKTGGKFSDKVDGAQTAGHDFVNREDAKHQDPAAATVPSEGQA